MLRVVAVALVLAVGGGSCRSGSDTGDGGKPQVVASFAPLAEIARRVGGDRVMVKDLTPPGTEPHDAELGADDLDAIEDADVMLYVGGDFQPAVTRAVRRAKRPVDVLREDEQDPHIWLDPPRWSDAVTVTEDALIAADPAGQEGYRGRAVVVRAELDQLHTSYQQGLRQCRTRLMITTHDSFGRLATRYQLDNQAIVGVSPEAEPDPKRLAELSDLIRRRGVTTVFSEPLLPARLAEALAREAGVSTAVLDPLEGSSPGGYRAAMERNLVALRAALGCT